MVESPRNDLFLQQLSLSVFVFKLGVQWLLAMDRVGKSKGLALDHLSQRLQKLGGSVRFGGRGREGTRIFSKRETHLNGKDVF